MSNDTYERVPSFRDVRGPLDKVRVFYGDFGPEVIDDLREDIQKARRDPDYSVVTNAPLNWVDVARGDIVLAADVGREQVEHLRADLEKAWEDPEFIPIFSFGIEVLHLPR